MFSVSEDFTYYLEKIPGTFIIIGCKQEGVDKVYMNHHPKLLLAAAKSVGHIVCDYCKLNE